MTRGKLNIKKPSVRRWRMTNQSKSIAIITAPVTLLNESAILFRFPLHKKDTFTNTANCPLWIFWFVCMKKKRGKGQRIHHSLL